MDQINLDYSTWMVRRLVGNIVSLNIMPYSAPAYAADMIGMKPETFDTIVEAEQNAFAGAPKTAITTLRGLGDCLVAKVSLASILHDQGEGSSFVDELENLYQTHPNDVDLTIHLAVLREGAGNIQGAIALCESLKDPLLSDNTRYFRDFALTVTCYNLACLYYKKDQDTPEATFPKVYENLKSSLEVAQNNPAKSITEWLKRELNRSVKEGVFQKIADKEKFQTLKTRIEELS